MTSIERSTSGTIVPLQFLKALCPASLGPRTKGKTNIAASSKASGRQAGLLLRQHLRPQMLPNRRPSLTRDDRRHDDHRKMDEARRFNVEVRPVPHGRARRWGPLRSRSSRPWSDREAIQNYKITNYEWEDVKRECLEKAICRANRQPLQALGKGHRAAVLSADTQVGRSALAPMSRRPWGCVPSRFCSQIASYMRPETIYWLRLFKAPAISLMRIRRNMSMRNSTASSPPSTRPQTQRCP